MTTDKVSVFSGADDTGWLRRKSSLWWFDASFAHSFTLFDLDGFYEENYFGKDHVPAEVVDVYVDCIVHYAELMLGRPLQSVLELGCGGGWFTEGFLRKSLDVMAVEGTRVGYERTLKRGIPKERVLRHDLRKPLSLGRTFDIVVCTEVAEHIECPFSSQLVTTIVEHGKVVWFSYAAPGENTAHYHHANEQPEKFWRNLFRFNEFGMSRLPREVTQAVWSRGKLLFYANDLTTVPECMRSEVDAPVPFESLGGKTPDVVWNVSGAKQLLRGYLSRIAPKALQGLRKIPDGGAGGPHGRGQ